MTPQDQQQQNIQSVGGDTVREQDKIMLVLSYLGILALIPFLTVKDSEYVKYHAKQGLALGVVFFVASIVINFIPFVGQILFCVMFLGDIVLMVLGITKALKGERWNIPLISDLAAKF